MNSFYVIYVNSLAELNEYSKQLKKSNKITKEKNKMTMFNPVTMIRNINGLSVGDSAYCGQYGKITCTRAANRVTKKPRLFKVAKSTLIRNGGNWTMTNLRKAIVG